ncbi:MAG: class I SAM-dependent methyltransferase [Nitrospinae bacterium]|nr:class I SAM-dependent methyltransferase [Nitrospinota bacterium]
MVTAKKKDSPGYWNSRAIQYGGSTGGYKAICSYGMPFFYNKYIDLIQQKAMRKILRTLDIRGKSVLDVGCGVGRWCRILSGMGAEVTGADLSEEMVKIARENSEGYGITYIASPVSSIDLPSRKFDLVTAVTVLQHITDGEEFNKSAANLTRLLKKGGKALIMEVAPGGGAPYMFSDILSVRTAGQYIAAFKAAGAALEGVYSVDVTPIKHRLLRLTKGWPRTLINTLIFFAVVVSLPIDLLFSGTRLLQRHSWHKVFLFSVPDD